MNPEAGLMQGFLRTKCLVDPVLRGLWSAGPCITGRRDEREAPYFQRMWNDRDFVSRMKSRSPTV